MRVFLDTNVLVSAFATRGMCADVLRVVLTEHVLVTSEVGLDELRRILHSRLRIPPSTIEEIERFLREHEVVAKPAAPSALALRDPDDRWLLASAVDGRADVLVTGDKDLLEVAGRAPIEILDPREFWEKIRRG